MKALGSDQIDILQNLGLEECEGISKLAWANLLTSANSFQGMLNRDPRQRATLDELLEHPFLGQNDLDLAIIQALTTNLGTHFSQSGCMPAFVVSNHSEILT